MRWCSLYVALRIRHLLAGGGGGGERGGWRGISLSDVVDHSSLIA